MSPVPPSFRSGHGLHRGPLRLSVAIQAFMDGVPGPRRGRVKVLLDALDTFLGDLAPLLAYTPVTGEQWVQSLPPGVQPEAREVLAEFRAFLREHGWLDAARPVNVFD
ncbi:MULTISPECIES: hypothetical protein [Deinococcus]|uniref:Uncharacterized protein n=1 Tax=Deinococcus rufus TaxID=2136097 RepID=A0ABV7Z9I2_9DEIO|nr:hypothetical protein [Deinococcus sp. AB2017081]WQE96143.1 hypothetical protein U2P90_04410 [Deinococcus sp. AB2017081]